MIVCHNPYYNPKYTNRNQKKVLVIYALNPNNYTNYIMQNKQIQKNIGKNLETKIERF